MARPEIESLVNFSERSARQALLMEMAPLAGEYDVSMKPVRPTRTGRQNRFFHGPLCRVWIEFNRAHGVLVTTEQAKLMFKVKACGEVDRQIDPRTGEVLVETFRSTAAYTVEEMSGFIERCIAYLITDWDLTPPETETYGFSLSRPQPQEVR